MEAFLNKLHSLEWVKLKVLFKSSVSSTTVAPSAVCAMEAITKAISDKTWGISSSEWANRPVFHFIGKKHNFKLHPEEIYSVEFLFTDKKIEEVQLWISTLIRYFSQEENCRTFYPVEISSPVTRNLSCLIQEVGEIPDEGEICLKFLTPLHFKVTPGKTRYYIDAQSFLKGIISRINRLFKENFNTDVTAEFETFPYFWEYTEIKHRSHSQPGHYQLINGCVGPLYLKGNFRQLKPWLYLATELHAGTKLSNSMGYFILHKESLPYFDARFPNLEEIKQIAHEVIDRYDDALFNLIKPESGSFNIEDVALNLFNQIKEGSYCPAPYNAFVIKTETGKERTVEQPEYQDIIAGIYALRLLSPVLDKAFEEESIGFRKGKSREKAIELVRDAINQGYLWVVESDIENFFPSINLNILENLLDRYIPEKDVNFKKFIKSIIRAKYKMEEQVFERQRGVAQGHPLSPCLTNLYLDAFDEQIKAFDVKLIRYADDFLIFCKDKAQAELILQKVENILSGLDLKIKPDKTAIKSVTEGFQFLGFNFSQAEADVFVPPDVRLLKKPLYITEPYVSVTVDGNSVCIRKGKQIVQTLPLRRISEIMIMEKAVISTSLIRKCVEHKIPLTVTLHSGYFLTTIRPDSKDYFLISSQHARKYSALSEATLVSLAQQVALTKIENYLYLFRQKYTSELSSVITELKKIIKRLEASTDINEIRGFEGIATRHIYSNLNYLIGNPAFHIEKRQRRPPDRINTLFNFGAYLLYSRINALIRSAGLNPYLGFLHSPSDEYESLVADLVDIFRARMERFIIRLVNLKVINENDFDSRGDGFYLTREGKHKFLSHFEDEFHRKSDPKKLSFKEKITLQVKILKEWVTKDNSLVFLRWAE